MCLASAYFRTKQRHPVLEDVVRMRLYPNRVEMETLFGEQKVVPGRVVEIDFAASKILLEDGGEADLSDER